ncbi:MAG: nicotinate-nucleotide--dimethylbenzimidazole phosphoribosyltransferase [Syntrophaceticus sp.]
MELRLQDVVNGIVPVSQGWRTKARERLNNLAVPIGSLGQLLDLAEQLAAIKETLKPSVKKKAIVTMAGDHGVVDEGVSTCPQEVTSQMVYNFVAGGAGINVLAEVAGAEVTVVDMGVAQDFDDLVAEGKIISHKVGYGTGNMAKGPAMTREQAVQSIEAGINVAAGLVHDGVELLGTGDMGIGNTTPSSAVFAALSGLSVREVTGRGTGISEEVLEHKIQVIQKALQVNKPDPADPLEVLAKVGGFEIGGIAGVILGAAYCRVPVVVDGFISTAGALLAQRIAPQAVDYMIAGHCSMEFPHRMMLEELELAPVLNMNMRLGEGTGAALAMCIIEGAAAVIGKMMTFEECGVARNKSKEYVQ